MKDEDEDDDDEEYEAELTSSLLLVSLVKAEANEECNRPDDLKGVRCDNG